MTHRTLTDYPSKSRLLRKLPDLSLADKVMALSDSLVKHDQVVTLEQRSEDMLRRYGNSRWIERQLEFAQVYHREIEEKLSQPLNDLLAPLMLPSKPDASL